jgi:hypothetical protein
VFVGALSTVAIVPVEACNPFEIDHVVYYHNIQYCEAYAR